MKTLIPLLIVVVVVSAAPISADVVYDWTGDTSGGRTATAVLTLANTYTPGTAVSNIDFLGFSFSEPPAIFYTVPGDGNFVSVSGILPAFSGVAPGTFSLVFDNGSFTSDSAPSWAFNGPGNSDSGNTHIWTLRPNVVPEPASAVLAGLSGLGLFARRRRWTVQR